MPGVDPVEEADPPTEEAPTEVDIVVAGTEDTEDTYTLVVTATVTMVVAMLSGIQVVELLLAISLQLPF